MSLHHNPTENEIIAILERSSLPVTILIEGADDFIIYRRLEEYLSTDVDVLGVGGRNTILSIFEKQIIRGEILKDKNIIYIADKDIWVNIGVPEKFKNEKIIFTSGYSIENDVFIDAKCDDIIDASNKKQSYTEDLQTFLNWYSLALQTTITNIETEQDIPSNRAIGKHPLEVFNKFSSLISLNPNEIYPDELLETLKNTLPLSIRGKSLLAIFTKHFKHHNNRALFEMVAVNPNEYIKNIFTQVEQAIYNDKS